eukprot:CAMPEP_0206425776 /NCGR_PEP_ID=MMETSP0324_2-20121206/3985_1 /ASSEMBLY_ACC=CAM_ASM_000836 /TAXON_ID=2866 /ORGANISM="Crypthecodinium cohnii, Strain Seligo" /LENGTH=40 /DNA_ID= /DNA_START= /DNA_END= /DNA_ORIENTATION=
MTIPIPFFEGSRITVGPSSLVVVALAAPAPSQQAAAAAAA